MDSTVATTVSPVSTDKKETNKKDATQRQIRGSSLLLIGRFVSRAVNFAVYILTVRYLSKTDYGAFSYALSIVQLGESIATFGLDRAITRFIPIYHERKEYDKLFGTLTMVLGTVVGIGTAFVLLFHVFQDWIDKSFIKDEQAVALLLILIFLAPLQSIDDLLIGMFAVFAKPRAIFFRKNVLAPGLRLVVVLALVLGHSSVVFLSAGYLIATLAGVLIYFVLVYRLLRDQGLWQYFNLKSITMPWFEIFAFTIPLLTSDLVYIVMNSMDAVVLERFRNVSDIAALRAVQPTATLNQLVMASFGTLFTPLAARMFSKNDREGINNLYWQTAVWIAVFTFPIFILTFSLAQPITVWMLGARYADSAIILALLSLGYYFNSALGFNGLTLKVYGKFRFIMILNIATVLVNLGAIILLIPRYGALGAAIGTTITLLLHNILKQWGLQLGTGINIFDRRYLRVYMIISITAIVLFLIQWATSASVYISLGLAAIASLVVFRLNRDLLDVGQTFPELLRFPFMKRILG
ncbi:MAG: flippase [Chloroflexi bacterium]|nr:flippase [Chloroflexota bacterium]